MSPVSARYVQPVAPGHDYVRTRQPIRVGCPQHLQGQGFGNVERAALGVSHEGDAAIRLQTCRRRQVCRGGRQIGVNLRRGLAVQRPLRLLAGIKADQGHLHRSCIYSPLFVAHREEDVSRFLDAL